MNEIIFYSLIFIGILIFSCFLVLKLIQVNENQFRFLLSFSSGYLISLLILHLLPESYETYGTSNQYFILVGFGSQIIIDYFSKGIDHGHVHVQKSKNIPYILFVALCIHSFIEGMPMISQHTNKIENIISIKISKQYVMGVLFHKIPIVLILTSTLKKYKKKNSFILFFIFIFCLTMPLGSLFLIILNNQSIISIQELQHIVLNISIGILLHIAIIILYENNKEHKFNIKKIMSILAGVISYFIMSIILN